MSKLDQRAEVPRRLQALRAEMERRSLDVLLTLAPGTQTYLAGFRALLYSRPIVLFVRTDATVLVVPGLEEAHARAEAAVDEVRAYYEHPARSGSRSHLECLDELLRGLPAGARMGIEGSAFPMALADRLRDRGFRLDDVEPVMTRLREVKDEAEIGLIREAARVLRAGVGASVAACTTGTTEIEVDAVGTSAVMSEVASFARPVTVEQLIMSPSGAERSTLPHTFSTTRRLTLGDGVIHTRQVGLNGYRAELERTVFVGPPPADALRVFEVMRSAQQAAIDAVSAGVRCRDVDRAARERFESAGLGAYAIHRSGHGIGIAPHEPPYLRFDNEQTLEEGMVVTIEPGVYVPGLGGFRHSDTVLVRRDGAELLTAFPSDAATLSASS